MHRVTRDDADVTRAVVLSLDTNHGRPALIDPDGPPGRPFGLWAPGANVIELTGNTGQPGFFQKPGGAAVEHPRPRAIHRRHRAGAWLRGLDFYGVKGVVGWHALPRTQACLDRSCARPAVRAGPVTPPRAG